MSDGSNKIELLPGVPVDAKTAMVFAAEQCPAGPDVSGVAIFWADGGDPVLVVAGKRDPVARLLTAALVEVVGLPGEYGPDLTDMEPEGSA